jgi:hypothetical protein
MHGLKSAYWPLKERGAQQVGEIRGSSRIASSYHLECIVQYNAVPLGPRRSKHCISPAKMRITRSGCRGGVLELYQIGPDLLYVILDSRHSSICDGIPITVIHMLASYLYQEIMNKIIRWDLINVGIPQDL